MSVGWIVMAYLIIGALCAALFAFAVKEGLDRQGEDADMDTAMRTAERSVESLPGGMAAALLAIALLWPACIAILIRNRAK